MDMFTDVLLNAGPIGLLAAYMMYWLQKQEAKHDGLTKHYIKKIEDLHGIVTGKHIHIYSPRTKV